MKITKDTHCLYNFEKTFFPIISKHQIERVSRNRFNWYLHTLTLAISEESAGGGEQLLHPVKLIFLDELGKKKKKVKFNQLFAAGIFLYFCKHVSSNEINTH